MIEMDDLDRSLEEYNAEAASKTASEAVLDKPKPLWQPTFTDEEDDDVEDEIKYTMQANRIYVIRDRIHRSQIDFQEKLKSVTTIQEREKNAVIFEWIGTISIVVILYAVLFFLQRPDWRIPFYCLVVGVTIFAIYQFKEVIKKTANFLILNIKASPSSFVERRKVNTYRKREEYWERKLADLKNKLERLSILERKLEKARYLSEKDAEEVEKLGIIDQKDSYYTEEKFTFGDLWEYFTHKKDMGGINSSK